jgi:hypothetical protein
MGSGRSVLKEQILDFRFWHRFGMRLRAKWKLLRERRSSRLFGYVWRGGSTYPSRNVTDLGGARVLWRGAIVRWLHSEPELSGASLACSGQFLSEILRSKVSVVRCSGSGMLMLVAAKHSTFSLTEYVDLVIHVKWLYRNVIPHINK